MKYLKGENNIHKGTDFLQIIKLNRDFKVFRYLILNNLQQKTFEFLSNLKIDNEKIYEPKVNIEVYKGNNILQTMKLMKNYYEAEDLNIVDKKLFELIHPKIKKILNEINL